MMLLVQVVFLSEYRKLSFTPNFWTPTFPVAASANLIIRWLTAEGFPLWHAWSWTLADIATAFVITVAAATVADRARNQTEMIAASAPDPVLRLRSRTRRRTSGKRGALPDRTNSGEPPASGRFPNLQPEQPHCLMAPCSVTNWRS
jgi:hypothetical protein